MSLSVQSVSNTFVHYTPDAAASYQCLDVCVLMVSQREQRSAPPYDSHVNLIILHIALHPSSSHVGANRRLGMPLLLLCRVVVDDVGDACDARALSPNDLCWLTLPSKIHTNYPDTSLSSLAAILPVTTINQ